MAYSALPIPDTSEARPGTASSSNSTSTTTAPLVPNSNHPPIPPDLLDLYTSILHTRLLTLGHRVGVSLSERFSASTASSPRPLFTSPLDAIKFLCKDLWTLLFKKQIDNLKTNHRGVYVLTDSMFRPLTKMSMTTRERTEAMRKAQTYLWFPCGLIRGVLESLGIEVTVQAETSELPSATFQIKTVQMRS